MDDPFVWGSSGAKKTPEQIAREREIAQALIAQGADFSPVQSWTQGAARVANALAGVVKERRADSAEKSNTATDKGILASLLAGSSDAGAAVAQTAAAAPVAPSASGDARYTMGNSGRDIAATPSSPEIYDQFIGTVKQAGLTNPYGLAAVAATGQAESAYSPKNAFGEWSDPSESGQSGQAGGILSWRAGRLDNLRKFASANGDDPARPSPETQAKFFLNEDPSLVAKLNSAGSAEEAQTLMNNAWKFAGYDRPGGEAGKRIAAANAFLPQFNGATNAADAIAQQAPVQVASADPSFMPAAAAPGEALPVMPAPQTVGPNPVPPQDSVARVAQAMTPVQQAMAMDPSFDGFSQNTGSSAPGQPPIPAAPIGPQMAPQTASASGINPAIIQALNDPAASPQTQKIAMVLLQQQMAKNAPMSQADQLGLQKTQLEIEALRNPQAKPSDLLAREKFAWEQQQAGVQKPTADIQEYEFAKGQGYKGDFVQFQLDQKKAGATSITNTMGGDSGKFFEAADKKRGEEFVATATAGEGAQRSLAQISGLEETLARAPTGFVGGLKQLAGQYGINTEGLDDIQAASATISGLIPSQRPPGSGTMSDGDVKMFKDSLPSIMNQPGGNAKIISTMKAIAGYDMQRGQIANQVLNREITPAEGQKLMSQIPNPLEGIGKAAAPAAAATPAPGSYRWNPETNQLEPQ